MPKGGLGQVTAFVPSKLGLYNQSDAALPHAYGAYAKTYTELKYDASRKLVPATGSHLRWRIVANGMGFGEPLQVLNTPTQFYFLMPLYGEPVVGSDEDPSIRLRRRYDLSGHPTLKRYITYFNFQIYSSQYANSSNVLLSKDNKLPFITISKAEYLDKLAEAVERKFLSEKDSTKRQKRLSIVEAARAKYQNRLNETAAVPSLQPSVLLENNPDIFDEQRASERRFPEFYVGSERVDAAGSRSPSRRPAKRCRC